MSRVCKIVKYFFFEISHLLIHRLIITFIFSPPKFLIESKKKTGRLKTEGANGMTKKNFNN